MSKKSFEQRLQEASQPLLKKLFNIIIEKKSNLCVAADFTSYSQISRFIEKCGDHICILKTHCDIIKDEPNFSVLKQLHALKKQHNFIWFEDRKLNEVPQILKAQYEVLVEYADLVTIEAKAGENSLRAIRDTINKANLGDDEPRGCLPLVELSYTVPGRHLPGDELLKDISSFPDICVGVISQHLKVPDTIIKATPGVHISKSGDTEGQNWNTPSDVIKRGTDIIIVGRGITAAPEENWLEMTIKYKESAWNAYQSQVA